MREALLFDTLPGNDVRCRLCAHQCLIREGGTGICGVRRNEGGVLHTVVYGYPVAQAVDPIEKKPLFHFYPGSDAFSFATAGCNFRCTFCQNADISQLRDDAVPKGQYVSPEALVVAALRYKCRSIAYTYTEPTVFFEYARDTAQLAREAKIANVFVTNGYMSREMLEVVSEREVPPLLDAANVDLKSFRDDFYRQECGARLQPVLDSLKLIKERGIWLEVTTLVIPGKNDSDEELADVASFIAHELGPDTPWHVSRFHPTFRMLDVSPTPPARLVRAREIGYENGLKHVYIGNVPGSQGEDTICPVCGKVIIERSGYVIRGKHMNGDRCGYCGAVIAGQF